jgi:hypothetical protein
MQIIQYEGVMDTQYVHHQVLYRCPRTLESVGLAPSYAGKTWDCTETTSPCREYMAITAPGTAPIDTPPGTGIPVGKGESEFYILEVTGVLGAGAYGMHEVSSWAKWSLMPNAHTCTLVCVNAWQLCMLEVAIIT